jgi:hypothetical protein
VSGGSIRSCAGAAAGSSRRRAASSRPWTEILAHPLLHCEYLLQL